MLVDVVQFVQLAGCFLTVQLVEVATHMNYIVSYLFGHVYASKYNNAVKVLKSQASGREQAL